MSDIVRGILFGAGILIGGGGFIAIGMGHTDRSMIRGGYAALIGLALVVASAWIY